MQRNYRLQESYEEFPPEYKLRDSRKLSEGFRTVGKKIIFDLRRGSTDFFCKFVKN